MESPNKGDFNKVKARLRMIDAEEKGLSDELSTEDQDYKPVTKHSLTEAGSKVPYRGSRDKINQESL